MTEPSEEAARDPARAQAAVWLARMRGPEAERWTPDFTRWRAATPENEAAYQVVLRKWEQSAFLANTRLGKERDLRRAATWSRHPIARTASVAAVLLLVLGAGALLYSRLRPGSSPAAPIAYASMDGRIREIGLPDGTRVTLDAGSEIQVDAPRRRARLLKGRARFDVAPVLGGRFVVDFAGGSIAADDDQFDIGLQGSLVRVVAWRGAVDISRGSQGAALQPVRIVRGQMLAFQPASGPVAPRQADIAELAWTRGMLAFDETRLADAVESINRYNGRRIALASSAIGELRVTGAFRADDPQGFARATAAMFHLSVVRLPDGSILLTPERKT